MAKTFENSDIKDMKTPVALGGKDEEPEHHNPNDTQSSAEKVLKNNASYETINNLMEDFVTTAPGRL